MTNPDRPGDRCAGSLHQTPSVKPGAAILANFLRDQGLLTADWEDAFAATNRAAYIPRHVWVEDHTRTPRPVERGRQPWKRAVYSDEPIVIQLAEGRVTWPNISREVTSSSTRPSVVMKMLRALDLERWNNVLHVGTGSGWTAALLGAYLDDRQVVSLEVDEEIAKWASRALRAAGHEKLEVYVSDGGEGFQLKAPYDRIISTAGVAAGHVPTAWICQTRPGGKIVTPWSPTLCDRGLLKLDVVHGDVAHGRIVDDVTCTRLRDQPLPHERAEEMARLVESNASVTESMTWADPVEMSEDADALMAIGLHLPGVQMSVRVENAHEWRVLLYDVATESASICHVTQEGRRNSIYKVRRYGPRWLWEEAETAWRWWVDAGRPHRRMFGVTVTRTEQWCWLDTPHNRLPDLLSHS